MRLRSQPDVGRGRSGSTADEHATLEERGGADPRAQWDAWASRSSAAPAKRVLVLASGFPSRVRPIHGVFVKERVRFVSQRPDVQVRVVSPIPYFPPIKWFRRWYPYSQIPSREMIDGLEVLRSRYFMPPAFGGYVESNLMFPAARRAARRLRPEFDFDLIDGHFIYATGVVAARLGKRYDKPVVITGRGEDILRFPDLPVIGDRIRQALGEATQLIALSEEIAEAMERQGADPDKITVIPNGVDLDKFHPVPTQQARQKLGLPLDRPIVVSVGYRIERKGFHVLVDAIPRMVERFPNVLVVIVGGEASWEADFLPEIERRVRANDVADHVLITGERPQHELANWYSAADLFALMTSREGSPNVLIEALSCGVPSVATPVGEISQVLADSRLGLVLPERSSQAAAAGIIDALSRTWDRGRIHRLMQARSWHETAKRVAEVFDKALLAHRRKNSAGTAQPK
jgi:glycosyltransferase involved in cell wall biosynthesis